MGGKGNYSDENVWNALYNTQLSPEDESRYTQWAQNLANQRGWSPQDIDRDYDMRGYWSENNGKETQYANGHFTDKFKKPNHPTFSNQSMYSGVNGNVGGEWNNTEGFWKFTPSPANFKIHGVDFMKRYFEKAEPGNELDLSVLNNTRRR